ncbi:MAG: ATP-binding cassette domain-containing protein [Myxococcales bacterium]|nr:ATP-binding cassette domain-containing protein [Myxococcales bacterium]
MRIELRDVRKRFGRQEVLKGIDLEIPHGARVALVGPNGSGKSTLLRILMGMLRAEGTALVDGRSPFEHRDALASRLGYVPQVAPQLGARVREIIRAVSTLRSIDVERVGSGLERLELDLDAIQSKPFHTLSGGMKQKLLIALAFASDASLFILDEPTASLDAQTRERFIEMLDEAAAGATVLLCSHRVDEIRRLVGRQIQLGEGRVVRDLEVAGDGVERVEAATESSCGGWSA